MEIPNVADKWSSGVNEITLGATKDKGGTNKDDYDRWFKMRPFYGF